MQLGAPRVGDPADVAAFNRASASAPAPLAPIIAELKQAAASYPPEDQAEIQQAVQILEHVSGPEPAGPGAGAGPGGGGLAALLGGGGLG